MTTSEDKTSANEGASKPKTMSVEDIRNLAPNRVIYDPTLKGFGARRRASGLVSYFVLYYTPERRRCRFTIGTHGQPWTPATARKKALEIISDVEIRGIDPAKAKREYRTATTVSELCDLYFQDAEAGRLLTRRGVKKKASTLDTDRGRIERHIKPLLGKLKVKAVCQGDIEKFMHDVAEGASAQRVKLPKKRATSKVTGGKGAATRTIGLLGAIFTYAERHQLVERNPVRGVIRFADGKRERRLTDEEYAALGRSLEMASADENPSKQGRARRVSMWPPAIAMAKFLALTGWRSGEAMQLTWGEIDFAGRVAKLKDTKSGESTRPLSAMVCDLLWAQSPGEDDHPVFPPSRGKTVMSGFPRFFGRIRKYGNLPRDITPNVLRHSFASLANDLGYTEATVGMMIGHKGGRSVTRGYIHPGDTLNVAADRVSSATALKLSGGTLVITTPEALPARAA